MEKLQYKIGLLCLLVLPLVACGRSAAPTPQPDAGLAQALPAIATLDALTGLGGHGVRAAAERRVSAVQTQNADVTAPLTSAFGQAGGGTWRFQVQPGLHAWTVYRLTAPQVGSTLLSLQAQGNPKLWMLVADYGSGQWQGMQMTLGITQFDLSSGGQWISPGSAIYCAFVLPAGSGVNAQLASLKLQYDDGVPSGPQLYVSPTGNDSDDGSQPHPWLTLQHAADVVQAGDTVNVLPGSYCGFMLQTSGTAGNPIVFHAQAGAKIVDQNKNAANHNGHTADGINIETWNGPPGISYVVVEGFTINGDDFPARPRTGIRTVGDETLPGHAHHITIRNNTITNCDEWGILTGHVDNMLIEGNECAGSKQQHGIYYSNASAHTTIKGNICHDNAGCGIHSNGDIDSGGDGIISDVTFDSNIVYNNGAGGPGGVNPPPGGSGINSDGVQSSTYKNNLLFNNHASGISLYDQDGAEPSKNDFVTNNTIIMAGDGRWALNIQDGSFGATVRNNILLDEQPNHGAIDISADSLPGFTSDYNAVKDRFTTDGGNSMLTLAQWKLATSQDTHSLTATQTDLFVLPNGGAAADYKLRVTSFALNKGGAQNAPGIDILGNPRPAKGAYDIGCYETQ